MNRRRMQSTSSWSAVAHASVKKGASVALVAGTLFPVETHASTFGSGRRVNAPQFGCMLPTSHVFIILVVAGAVNVAKIAPHTNTGIVSCLSRCKVVSYNALTFPGATLLSSFQKQ